MPSSRETTLVAPVGLPSPSTSGTVTAMTWVPKRSWSQAERANCWERNPNASQSAREISHLSAKRSAASNWLVVLEFMS